MSKIFELIEELCPDGVAYKPLGEIAELVRGNGMPKTDFIDSGVGAIHYGQIYTWYGVWTDKVISFVPEEKAVKLVKVNTGDIIITNTSENLEDVCKAVAWLGEDDIVTGGHATVIRHTQNPKYLSYYFQSVEFQRAKKKFAFGAKVIDVSAKNLAKIEIPVPPLEVQEEIVRILDKFTLLEAELEAELEARAKQYAFYCESFLNYHQKGLISNKVCWKPLLEVAIIGTGSRNTNQAIPDGKYPFFVRSQTPLTINSFDYDEKAIITAGDGVGVGKVFHYQDGKYALHQRAYRIVIKDPLLMPKFVFYYMQNNFKRYLEKTAVHASVTSLRKPMFEKYKIPVPSLAEQASIISALDRFDALVNDISSGLPAEIAARRKQYEYYRDKLLTFKELPQPAPQEQP